MQEELLILDGEGGVHPDLGHGSRTLSLVVTQAEGGVRGVWDHSVTCVLSVHKPLLDTTRLTLLMRFKILLFVLSCFTLSI